MYANICRYIFNKSNKRDFVNYFENTANVNLLREGIGLNSVEKAKRNELINRDRRKNKSINSEIILE